MKINKKSCQLLKFRLINRLTSVPNFRHTMFLSVQVIKLLFQDTGFSLPCKVCKSAMSLFLTEVEDIRQQIFLSKFHENLKGGDSIFNFDSADNLHLRLLTRVGFFRQNFLILSEVFLYMERSKNHEKKYHNRAKKSPS